jgi:nitrogen fixation NifU-like protein
MRAVFLMLMGSVMLVPECGDSVRVYIHVNGEYLKDIKYEVYGCPAAIAICSIYSEMIKGKTLEEAMAIDPVDINEALEGLPDSKLHCSNMIMEAFCRAIIDYITRLSKDLQSGK